MVLKLEGSLTWLQPQFSISLACFVLFQSLTTGKFIRLEYYVVTILRHFFLLTHLQCKHHVGKHLRQWPHHHVEVRTVWDSPVTSLVCVLLCEEMQHYDIDYFQLYFHLTLAVDHLYRQSFRSCITNTTHSPAINLHSGSLYIFTPVITRKDKTHTGIISISTTSSWPLSSWYRPGQVTTQ